jgi:hypothetical protein
MDAVTEFSSVFPGVSETDLTVVAGNHGLSLNADLRPWDGGRGLSVQQLESLLAAVGPGKPNEALVAYLLAIYCSGKRDGLDPLDPGRSEAGCA